MAGRPRVVGDAAAEPHAHAPSRAFEKLVPNNIRSQTLRHQHVLVASVHDRASRGAADRPAPRPHCRCGHAGLRAGDGGGGRLGRCSGGNGRSPRVTTSARARSSPMTRPLCSRNSSTRSKQGSRAGGRSAATNRRSASSPERHTVAPWRGASYIGIGSGGPGWGAGCGGTGSGTGSGPGGWGSGAGVSEREASKRLGYPGGYTDMSFVATGLRRLTAPLPPCRASRPCGRGRCPSCARRRRRRPPGRCRTARSRSRAAPGAAGGRRGRGR